MAIIGFINTPPPIPAIPPVPPPGGASSAGAAVITGTAARLGARFPAAALIIGTAAVMVWAWRNSRPPEVQDAPHKETTTWVYYTQPGNTYYQIQVTSFGRYWTTQNPATGESPATTLNEWLEGGVWRGKGFASWTSGHSYKIGSVSATVVPGSPADVSFFGPGSQKMIVSMTVTLDTGVSAAWRMTSNMGARQKVIIKPLTFNPEQVPGWPTLPPPWTPPPINPEEEDRKRRERPAAPPPSPATPKPVKPAQPKRTDPMPGPGDPAREQPPAQPPATPRPAAPPGLDEQIPGLRRELGAIRDALAKATSGQGAGGQGADPNAAQKGTATWTPTQPNGAPAPQPAPAPAKATDPTQHLTKAGPVTAPDVRPDLPGIAQEVGRIERKLANMMGPDGSDLGALLDLLKVIYDLLTNHVDGTQYTVTAACTTAGETEPRTATIDVPGGLTREEAAIARLDAIAALMAKAQILKQATCGGRNTTSPTNNVTVTAYEVIKE